jgi:hypothetical protein
MKHIENIINENDVDDEPHESNLKFSFNTRDNKLKEEIIQTVPVPNKKNKKNVYQENLEKIRKEKEMVSKMESVRIKANSRKNYSDDSDEEENKLIEPIKENKIKIEKLKYNYRDSDQEIEKDEITKQIGIPQKNALLKKEINEIPLQFDKNDTYENSFEAKVKNLQKITKSNDKFSERDLSKKYEIRPSKTKIYKDASTIGKFKTIQRNTNLYSEKELNISKKSISSVSAAKPRIKLNENHRTNSKLKNNQTQTEINQLRKEISKLKSENDKLKGNLIQEKSKNEKFKQLTEELIRFYE